MPCQNDHCRKCTYFWLCRVIHKLFPKIDESEAGIYLANQKPIFIPPTKKLDSFDKLKALTQSTNPKLQLIWP